LVDLALKGAGKDKTSWRFWVRGKKKSRAGIIILIQECGTDSRISSSFMLKLFTTVGTIGGDRLPPEAETSSVV
jgi:hypothetical protein